MKYYDLDPYEKQILADFEKGEFRRVKKFAKEKARFEKIAHYTLSKKKNINIRLTEKVLIKLKAKAAASGIPYQTLVSSVLHRFAMGNL